MKLISENHQKYSDLKKIKELKDVISKNDTNKQTL
jgi:hypothetical protein